MHFQIRVSVALFCVLAAGILTASSVAAEGFPLWDTDGVTVCSADGGQGGAQLVSDGSGGAILAWGDFRNGGAYYDIYAQRVDANGNTLWATDGVSLCLATFDEEHRRIISDGSGGAIVAWRDYRSFNIDIYAQRVYSDGNTAWYTDGVTVCATAYESRDPEIAPDGSEGAIIAWQDERTGWLNDDIYAQRVYSDGNTAWYTDGVAICAATYKQGSPVIAADGSEGAIVAWYDLRNGYLNDDIYAQRIDSNGQTLWYTNGVSICVAANVQSGPQIISDGLGGAIVAWEDERNGSDYDIYAQRVNANGQTLWHADGVSLCTATRHQVPVQMISDGSGGAIVTWEEGGGTSQDLYAQRVDSNGQTLWHTDGVSICIANSFQRQPQITSDGSGGAIVTWHDNRNGPDNPDIYAQRVGANGQTLWHANGIGLCLTPDWQSTPQIASDESGGAIVAWSDPRSGESHIYAQRVGDVIPTDFVHLPLVLKSYQ